MTLLSHCLLVCIAIELKLYCNVRWASSRLRSPSNWLFVQRIARLKNTQSQHYWPLLDIRWIPLTKRQKCGLFFSISWRHGAIEVQKDERWSFWTMKSYSNCPSTLHGTIYIIAKCSSMIPSCRWHVWISRYGFNDSLRDITLHCKYYFPLLYRFLTSRSSLWCYCLLLVANVGLNKIGTKIYGKCWCHDTLFDFLFVSFYFRGRFLF